MSRRRHTAARTGIVHNIRLRDILTQRIRRNPLVGLTPQRAVELYDLYRKGSYADVMLAWASIEEADETLATVVDRRQSALKEMTWEIKINAAATGDSAALQQLAEEQQDYLAGEYDRISNITNAIAWLGMSRFRGYSHLEIVRRGRDISWEPIDHCLLARPVYDGRWYYNAKAASQAMQLEDLDTSCIIMMETARPIDLACMFLVVAKAHAVSGWDGFLDVFGNPSIFFKYPPGTSDDLARTYQSIVEEIIGDGRGCYPDGGDIKLVETTADNGTTFRERAEWCDKGIVRRATGGQLTVLAESGTGTLAGNAQAETFRMLAAADGSDITECINRQYTDRLLATRFPGKRRLAYWELAYADENEIKDKVENLVRIGALGYRAKDETVSELLGLEVTSANLDPTALYAVKSLGYRPEMLPLEQRVGMPLEDVPDPMAVPPPGGIVTNSGGAPTTPAAAEEPPLTPGELEALRLLGTPSAPARTASAAEAAEQALQAAAAPFAPDDPQRGGKAVANPLQNANTGDPGAASGGLIENKGPYRCNKPHCRGHREPVRGTTRGARTRGERSSNPYQARDGATASEKVDAVHKSIAKTARKGGSVRGAATVGRNKVDIRGGHPDYYGSRHAARHFKPGDTTPRKAARALVHGKGEKVPGGKASSHKGNQSVTYKSRRKRMKYITSYRNKKKPRSGTGDQDR